MGLDTFGQQGLMTRKGEIVFFSIAPVNISVLSKPHIEEKIIRLTALLKVVPNIEILCLDSAERFDPNKAYLLRRIEKEPSPVIRELLRQDLLFLDRVQIEMATSRKFVFCIRSWQKDTLTLMNRVQSAIADHGFEVHHLTKNDIKLMLSIYFGAGDNILPDIEGIEFIERVENNESNTDYGAAEGAEAEAAEKEGAYS